MAENKAELLQSLRIERQVAPAPSRRRLRPVVAAAGLLIVAVVLGYFALPLLFSSGRQADEAAAAKPVPAPVAEPPRARGLIASGYVVARRKATIAAEVTGKVAEVLVEEGMVVKEGDVVARLDSVLAERDLALAQSRADAAAAAIGAIAADLRDAERILSRAQSLVQRNVVSEAEVTKDEARVGVLRAQLKQSQAQFETAALDAKRAADVVDKHRIRAPFPGVVVERSAQPGEMISPLSVGGSTRTGICTVVDMDSIEVEVDVNEAFIGRVQPGLPVAAVLDAYPDWTIPAAVIAIVPTANREKATVKVRIGLKQKDPRILPDMAVKVTFEDAGSGVLPSDKSAATNEVRR